MPKAIGIYRELKLAGKPGSDQRILDLTAQELNKLGFEASNVFSEQFDFSQPVDLVFTMARGKEINDALFDKQNQGWFVINAPKAIRFSFDRKTTYLKMMELGANIPQTEFKKIEEVDFASFNGPKILKPANRHEFWFKVTTQEEFDKAMAEYKTQGIDEILVQEFIIGESIKYYAIDGEVILAPAAREKFQAQVSEINRQVMLTKTATGLKIFGGDFIISETGVPYCVDANDWPSMGSLEGFTQEEAAAKIAKLIEQEYNNFKK